MPSAEVMTETSPQPPHGNPTQNQPPRSLQAATDTRKAVLAMPCPSTGSAGPSSGPFGSKANGDPERPDRPGRRRPFSSLMKKLANFKATSSSDGTRHTNPKAIKTKASSKSKNRPSKNNNPYLQSARVGTVDPSENGGNSASMVSSARTSTTTATGEYNGSMRSSIEDDGRSPPTSRSMAPTVSTDHETCRSISAPSHGASSLAGTSRTANGGIDSRRGGDSTFSSPAPSVRSLATTLTTIQSMAPHANPNATLGSQHQHLGSTGHGNGHGHSHTHGHSSHLSNSQVIHFNQPFPTTVSPASAIPSHLTSLTTTTAPQTPVNAHTNTANQPTTYSSATANNLLTDNASILTLASSSKRRRRRSLDTDASVRALAPSSLFGGSRESLPLSILSATVIDGAGPATPGLHGPRGGVNDRTSIYSTTGILAASERNSFYAKQSVGPGDGASVRSGLIGHGRAESISGSIGGIATSSLAIPRETEGEYEQAGIHRSGLDDRVDREGEESQDHEIKH